MSDVLNTLIDDARQALLREIAPAVGRKDLHEAFAAWLAPGALPGLGIDGAAELAAKASGAERHSSHVAVLGLAAQVRPLGENEKEALLAGLNWMVDREPVVGGTPMGFCMDGVTLAALILGAKAVGDKGLWAKTRAWVSRCREATAGGQGLAVWQEWLIATVAEQAGLLWARKLGDGPDAADVRVALRAKGAGTGGSAASLEQDEQDVLAVIRKGSTGLGVLRAALRLAALDWVRRDRPVSDLRVVTVTDLCALLRRVPVAMKKWTWEDTPRTKTSPAARQWHVDNEYHVQNILWLLLAPIFSDLTDEDATPKVGPVQPRADLCIPPLRVIVEVKFMRGGDPPKKMVEQIAEDASLYLVAGSRYDSLIPFIWDDSRRTEHHEEMIRGLRQITGVADAIIMPRPGGMVEVAPAAGSAKKGATKKAAPKGKPSKP